MKDIIGFEGLYKINKEGDIYSIPRNGTNGGYIKKQIVSGYYHVNLFRLKSNNFYLHRLIAIHFIPNPNNYIQINHKNGIKTDNRIENLEWCTPQQNVIHATKLGLNKVPVPFFKGKLGEDNYQSIDVVQLSAGMTFIKLWKGISDAKRKLKITGNISKAYKENRIAGGFRWMLKSEYEEYISNKKTA